MKSVLAALDAAMPDEIKMVEVKIREHVIPAPELFEWGLIIMKSIMGVGH